LHRERLVEGNPVGGHRIKARGHRETLAEHAAGVGTLLIRQHNEHVRSVHAIDPRVGEARHVVVGTRVEIDCVQRTVQKPVPSDGGHRAGVGRRSGMFRLKRHHGLGSPC
jgi:hypothetical protein